MNGFVIAVGVSFIPLHEEALRVAERIGEVSVTLSKGTCRVPNVEESIKRETDKGRLGFKRRNVRC